MLAESVSKWSQVLNACSDGVGKVVFIDMNTYILTEGRNFKTLCSLGSCCVFTKKTLQGIEHDADSAYRVCIHYRNFWTL